MCNIITIVSSVCWHDLPHYLNSDAIGLVAVRLLFIWGQGLAEAAAERRFGSLDDSGFAISCFKSCKATRGSLAAETLSGRTIGDAAGCWCSG